LRYINVSFARKLEVERGKTDGISLKYTERKGYVHVEDVLTDPSELHIDFGVIMLIYQLEIFNTSFIYTPVKVKNEGLNLLIPLWWFIKEEHNVVLFVFGEFTLDTLIFCVSVWPIQLLSFSVDHGEKHFHSSWSFRSEHVSFIL